jgi:hypothetical protein
VGYRKITIEGVEWRWNEERGRTRDFSVGGGIGDGENGNNRNGKRGIRKRSTKRNTREQIQRGWHSKKDNEEGKSEGILLECRGF